MRPSFHIPIITVGQNAIVYDLNYTLPQLPVHWHSHILCGSYTTCSPSDAKQSFQNESPIVSSKPVSSFPLALRHSSPFSESCLSIPSPFLPPDPSPPLLLGTPFPPLFAQEKPIQTSDLKFPLAPFPGLG